MQQVISELARLRRRTHLMLILQRSAVVIACVVGSLVGLIVIDFALRLPPALRLLLLIAGVTAFGIALWRYLFVALGYRPSLTQLALRVERSLPALRGRLASAVEFAAAGVDQSNPLAARSVRETQRRLSGEAVGRIVRPNRTLRDAGIMLVLLAFTAVLAVAFPTAANTGLRRIMLPLGSAQWPARTAVASLMHEVLPAAGVYPQGPAMPLRASNETAGDPEGRVDAYLRYRRAGAFEPWQRVVLTHQTERLHERLIDTNAEAVEVYFATQDNRTERELIELVPAPSVERARLTVRPPAYAAGRIEPARADLGPGIDERAVTEEPSLVGSEVDLTVQLNKPLPVPHDPDRRDSWLRATLEWTDDELPFFATNPHDPAQWSISWSLTRSTALPLKLVDRYGLRNAEPIRYRIEAVEDLPPSVVVTHPQSDETVLPGAVIELAGEAKDDVAVLRIGFETDLHRGASSESNEPLGFAPQRETDAATAGIEAELDLSEFELEPGDVVTVTAVADDVYEFEGQRHATSVSPPRRLRVVSELDFAAQLRRQLSAVRQNAIRLETQQAELQDDVRQSSVQPGLQRAQAQIGERIAEQRDLIAELAQQLRRNRLEDAQLSELFQQSSDLLDYAGRAANKAVESIEARAQDGPVEPSEDDRALERASEPDRPIVDAQQEVRAELSDLIELLDRDEDTWLVQRQLKGLLEQQLELQECTARLALETIGQSLENLTPQQRSELERIADAQLELPEGARRVIEEMRRRAPALEELDPQSASGLRSAADTGEEREVDRDMEQAGERIAQNQLQNAAGAQERAVQTLQRMLDDIEESKRAQAEELLRQLASLIQSIERLIVVQENELIALAESVAATDFTGRDHAMIRLSQNSQSVAAEARAAGQDVRRIARALDRASDAQGAAVSALRAEPIAADDARLAEERSLEQLKEARDLAEELEQKTQDEQVRKQREELIEAYRELAEKQVALRTDTLELVEREGELTRRQLVDARRFGNVQHEIRLALTDLADSTQELLESKVFTYVHELMDGWADDASQRLWNGEVDVEVTDRQQMIAESIARQIEAIEDATRPPDEFAKERQQSGAGASGGQPSLIPPEAEIRRVRGLQEQVYDQTRSLDGRADLSEAQRRQRLRELGQMQRTLIELGEAMLEQLQQGAGGDEPPGAIDK